MAQIDIEKLTEIITQADQIFLSAKGEQVLVDLLKIQEQIDNAISEAKVKLEAAALKANPNFTSIQSDKIKVYYRAFGQKYYIDEQQVNMAPKELYTSEEKVVYKIDTKALEKWIDKNGGMPTGIVEIERKKQLTFGLKKEKGGHDEQ